jgi:hypothetical protein
MADRYKGKKLSVIFPDNIFDILEKLATDDARSNSSMAIILIKEALKARGHTDI